jgi:CRISPR-associated endonuclease/helicase Cas3
LADADLAGDELADLLSDYPLKPHELLRDRSDPVYKHLVELAKEHGERPAWLVDEKGEMETIRLEELVQQRERLNYRVVVLPPAVGGLAAGLLDGKAGFDATAQYDVADEWRDNAGNQLRRRVWDDESAPSGMRLVRTLDTKPDSEEAEEGSASERSYWR